MRLDIIINSKLEGKSKRRSRFGGSKQLKYFLITLFLLLSPTISFAQYAETEGSIADLQSDSLTIIDKEILRLRSIAENGDKAGFARLLQSLLEQNIPESFYKLGKFYEKLPPESLIYKSDTKLATKYYQKALDVAVEKKAE